MICQNIERKKNRSKLLFLHPCRIFRFLFLRTFVRYFGESMLQFFVGQWVAVKGNFSFYSWGEKGRCKPGTFTFPGNDKHTISYVVWFPSPERVMEQSNWRPRSLHQLVQWAFKLIGKISYLSNETLFALNLVTCLKQSFLLSLYLIQKIYQLKNLRFYA